MTDQEAKTKWTEANHLEKWRTLCGEFGRFIQSGTQIGDTVFLKVTLDGLTPWQMEAVLQYYSRLPMKTQTMFL